MISTRKIATCLLIGTLTFTGRAMVAEAAETSEVPVAGISVLLEKVYQTTQNADEKITQVLLSETTSQYANLAFAQVTNYVNIRSKDNENSDILGKLYDNSAATILEKKGDWYRVKSGSVTGYIKSEYLLTGDKVKELANTLGTRLATVNTTTLKVREKASVDAEVLTLVPQGKQLKVTKETDGWVKVSIDDNTSGYVSTDYVKLWNEYEEAISMEEEKERLEQEAEAQEAQERPQEIRSMSVVSTAERTASSERSSSSNTSSSDNSSSTSSSSGSSSETASSQDISSTSDTSEQSTLRSKIVTYALQFEGNPYVWGGTSLTSGADCSGFTQSVFAHFGVYIPRTSRTQAVGGQRISISEMQPGDLIFYTRNGTINHVALYIGNGKVINASSPKTGIRITNYDYRQPYKVVSYLN